ncbi:hypothetical protein MYOV003v1_p0170 [Vibrio phage 207E48.1]|nr:hypothetical protein MYOV003v1_p0170 [Vibrio phage 207E48.1]
MEYFINFWLVAVCVAVVTFFLPVLAKRMDGEKHPTWKQSTVWAVKALLVIGIGSHLTLLLNYVG